MDTAPVNNMSAATWSSDTGKNSMVLDSQDFMKIMITELTNQDPLEPVSNQDLLNQMTAIQQLQSSQEMSKSFESLMDRYDSLLVRQELSTASGIIEQLVSGNTTNGQFALGRVVAVNLDGRDVLLELDTGQRINIKDIIRLGGSNSQDIIGEMVLGITAAGERVVGEIVSVEVDGSHVTLHLKQPGKPEGETVAVPLANASIINRDTANLLIGYTARGLGNREGIVESVEWTAEGVLLNIIDSEGGNETLPLTELTGIY